MQKNQFLFYIFLLTLGLLNMPSSFAEGTVKKPRQQNFSFQKLTGTFDRASAQRGFLVYKEVCSSCHSLKFVCYRNLKDLGFTDAEIKAIAAENTIEGGPNDDGEMQERPCEITDTIHGGYPNEKAAAAANNGSVPPDLSLMTKARTDGANYVYSILTGYHKTPPKNMLIGEGQYYNPYMSGGIIAMAPPLSKDLVSYPDGTPSTVSQMSKDVVTFLAWAAEPEMEERKALGINVLFYLLIMTAVFYLSMRRVWSRVKKK